MKCTMQLKQVFVQWKTLPYINTNVNGFSNLITAAKDFKVKKFYYASSSSVYGESIKFPLNEKEKYIQKIFMVSQKI